MQTHLPAIIFGNFLIIVGMWMLMTQRAASRAMDLQPPEEIDRKFQSHRIWRRTQVAGMILLIGIMIPVGDTLINWKHVPATFAVYWLVVLTLAIWTGLLAIGDMAATKAHMMTELNQLHRRNLELENLARRIQEGQSDRRREQ